MLGEKSGALAGGERVRGGGDGFCGEDAKGRDPVGVLRGLFDERLALNAGALDLRGRFARRRGRFAVEVRVVAVDSLVGTALK